MKNEKLFALLKKYLTGECTAEEQDVVDRWFGSLDDNPDDERLLNAAETKSLEEKVLDRIKADIRSGNDTAPLKTSGRFVLTAPYKIAAALVLVALVGAGIFLYKFSHPATVFRDAASVENSSIQKIANNTNSATVHRLSDGSVISLYPGGIIEFPRVFSVERRDIRLVGEAFFDVAKEKNRPFIINTGDVTIRVLGTSFNVKAYRGSKQITVAVKTGKVSVYDSNKKAVNEEIILTPNQEVVYNTENANFLKKLVEDPQIILEKPTLFEMEHDGTPVDKIFKVLEENYGIDIVYDAQVLSACTLTTSMDEEGLYERIEIICQAIGAQYEIKEGTIYINSAGCQ
jgi:transmembrane sensor